MRTHQTILLHCFHMKVVYIVSLVQQRVMLVKAPMAFERLHFSLRIENNLRLQTSRTSIDKVHIGRICLVIRTQNKVEIRICGIKVFYEYASFVPQIITFECKLWYQSSYLMYVVTRHWTKRKSCLLGSVVSNGMFCITGYSTICVVWCHWHGTEARSYWVSRKLH